MGNCTADMEWFTGERSHIRRDSCHGHNSLCADIAHLTWHTKVINRLKPQMPLKKGGGGRERLIIATAIMNGCFLTVTIILGIPSSLESCTCFETYHSRNHMVNQAVTSVIVYPSKYWSS